MTITRDQMKSEILVFLNKQNNYQGFFSDDKIHQVIQECVDFVAAEMFLVNEGWLSAIESITTAAGDTSAAIPTDVAMIYDARYLFGDTYLPMVYDASPRQVAYASSSGAQQSPYRYKIVGNSIYFQPALAEGGAAYLQLECAKYPTAMTLGSSNLMTRLDRAFQHYIKYRSCGILAAQMGKEYREWQQYENEWYDKMVNLLQKRVRQPTFIRDFEG